MELDEQDTPGPALIHQGLVSKCNHTGALQQETPVIISVTAAGSELQVSKPIQVQTHCIHTHNASI